MWERGARAPCFFFSEVAAGTHARDVLGDQAPCISRAPCPLESRLASRSACSACGAWSVPAGAVRGRGTRIGAFLKLKNHLHARDCRKCLEGASHCDRAPARPAQPEAPCPMWHTPHATPHVGPRPPPPHIVRSRRVAHAGTRESSSFDTKNVVFWTKFFLQVYVCSTRLYPHHPPRRSSIARLAGQVGRAHTHTHTERTLM